MTRTSEDFLRSRAARFPKLATLAARLQPSLTPRRNLQSLVSTDARPKRCAWTVLLVFLHPSLYHTRAASMCEE